MLCPLFIYIGGNMECDLRMGDHWTMTSASSIAIGVLQLDTHSNHVVDLSYMSNKSKVNTRYLLSDFLFNCFILFWECWIAAMTLDWSTYIMVVEFHKKRICNCHQLDGMVKVTSLGENYTNILQCMVWVKVVLHHLKRIVLYIFK